MINILYHMLNDEKIHSIDSLAGELGISKNKTERALNLLKNRDFLNPTDLSLKKYKLDQDIKCCIDSREEVEELIDRELTTPDEILKAHQEAMTPGHAAISLDGEPMLYPHMSGLVEGFKERGMTTFIVSNGTLPEKIEQLNPLPSQLYISLPASNEHLYKQVCRPMVKNGWDKINKTLDLIESLSCRTLIRLTAVKDLNINEQLINQYAEIVKKSNPNFFEIKGFTLQAKALLIKERIKSDKPVQSFFPDYAYLEAIALKFEETSGFPLIYKNKASRDFLFAVNWDKNKDPKINL